MWKYRSSHLNSLGRNSVFRCISQSADVFLWMLNDRTWCFSWQRFSSILRSPESFFGHQTAVGVWGRRRSMARVQTQGKLWAEWGLRLSCETTFVFLGGGLKKKKKVKTISTALFPQSGTQTECTANSEDIERKYQQNQAGSMLLKVKGHSYKLDFGGWVLFFY